MYVLILFEMKTVSYAHVDDQGYRQSQDDHCSREPRDIPRVLEEGLAAVGGGGGSGRGSGRDDNCDVSGVRQQAPVSRCRCHRVSGTNGERCDCRFDI